MTRPLQELLSETRTLAAAGRTDVAVSDICYDSRSVQPGSVFVALRGEKCDGHQFAGAAMEAGAAAVVAEDMPAPGIGGEAAWIRVPDTRRALADLSAAFFGFPSRSLTAVGVTGTNGKTTTAFLIHHLLSMAWRRCGLLGTVQYHDGIEARRATRTTPQSRDLQELLAQMRDNGCRGVAMEVSSHALVQSRVRRVRFAAGVFTNLTQDHLDYHGGMEEYFKAKALLFEQMAAQEGDRQGAMIVNIDDSYGKRLVRTRPPELRCLTFGFGVPADFRALSPKSDFNGTTFELQAKGRSFLVRLPLIGSFNVLNAIAALAAGNAVGLNLRESIERLAEAPQVPGRLEAVSGKRPFKVFVDYAHTPDAVENVLRTVRDLQPRRLVTVLGCGGDRDRAKRPHMGAAAARFSDLCILTSDNPRGEAPGAILDDIERGMGGAEYRKIEDRREAIREAILGAAAGDIIVIAGKGHEAEQQFANRTEPFDDREVARGFVRQWEPADSRAG